MNNNQVISRKEIADIVQMSPRQFTRREKSMGLDAARLPGTKGHFARWDRFRVLRILHLDKLS